MSATPPRRQRSGAGALASFVSRPTSVVFVGIGMILVQLAYRGWALYGGWFLIDDYGFLSDIVGQDLTLDYLFHPHNDHLQPLGFLFVWIVGQSTPYDWALASTITIGLQALASVACLAFLIRLCGRKWSTLIPLGFYLFAVITLPGFLWWCVAMMQVPQQLAAFAAMGFHTEYARTRRKRYIALTAVALAFGMLCDVKVAFVGLALAFLSLYLSDSVGLVARLKDAVVRQWLAWLVYGGLFVSYLALYLSLNPLSDRESPDRIGVFEVMVRYTMGPTFLGGPWEWGQMTDTPLVPAQPPEWAVTITWVVLSLLLFRAVRRRPATAWVGVLFVIAVVINVLMVSTARGAIFGKVLGLEVRYLGDLAPTLVLVVAVLATGLRPTRAGAEAVEAGLGARRGRRVEPVELPSRRQVAVGAVVVIAALGGSMISNTKYVNNWHSDYPAREFFQNVVAQTQDRQLFILDQPVPLDVIPRDDIVAAFERPSQVLRPLGDRVSASLAANDVEVLDPTGIAYKATVAAKLSSPTGPVEDCGYRIREKATTIPLELLPLAEPPGEFWWGSIAYLAGENGTASFTIGSTTTDMEVKRGLHDFVFLGKGDPAKASVQTRSGIALCFDNIRIGSLEPRAGAGTS